MHDMSAAAAAVHACNVMVALQARLGLALAGRLARLRSAAATLTGSDASHAAALLEGSVVGSPRGESARGTCVE
jgi:hypothetical protein